MTALLEARGLALPGRLDPTDLSVDQGRLVGLIGPNGSGKTSLLRSLAGIEPQSPGALTIAGEPVGEAPPARRMRLLSFLPASRPLVWPIPVRDVVALGLPAVDPERVEALLDQFELAALADRPVNSLSTGERSRALLARAMAAQPRLLLLDEPLANLDPYWVLRLIDIVRESLAEGGRSGIVSLHDLAQAERFDGLLLMAEGRIIADGSPGEILASESLGSAFRVERTAEGWAIRTLADRRSSP